MRRVLAAPLCLILGCGDAVVGADYRGEPILRLTGQIESVGPGVELSSDERALVSMFWNTSLSQTSPELRPQDSVSTGIQFPSTFEIRIFDPPTDDHLVRSDGRFGVGLLLVYVDGNANGRRDSGERFIGGSLAKAVVWARETISAEESPFDSELPEGFSLVNQPFASCSNRERPPAARPGDDGDSHVRMCRGDDSCLPEFSCDAQFSVCVPRESFRLMISGDFNLGRAGCRSR